MLARGEVHVLVGELLTTCVVAKRSRVGVRVGAFRGHPPISTQTRDTRLQCDRSFPKAHRGRARARDPCCATHRKESWPSGLEGTVCHALGEGVCQHSLVT